MQVPPELANFTVRYVEDALADSFRSVEVYQTRWLLQALAVIDTPVVSSF
ncbi:hypothetical protein [Pseudomonas sp. G2-4]|nr:hypothetical protein [Pseudomonas sp. G2-4]WHS57770.1 hypothetical protein QNH97_14930 [Pseudomonas sp. G2-4]